MNKTAVLRNYLQYYFSAKTRYGIHSPFVFDFICNVLNKKTNFREIGDIEAIRKELKKNKIQITTSDFGAGSNHCPENTRRVSDIAKKSLKSRKHASLFYRMIKYYNPGKIMELGTSLGITTCYLAKANPSAEIITIEGCDKIAGIAKENAAKLGLKNISFITGNFDALLDDVVRKQKPNFIFFDGNHTREATIRYFETCLSCVKNNSIFVFDDINWSDGMKKTWEIIKKHNMVTVTIDLYFMGLVFFRKELSRENFVIRF